VRKQVVDMRARREYMKVIKHYGSIIGQKLEHGKIDEDSFWWFSRKLGEWYSNYSPMKEVEDFTGV
jgi:hypothetical protein